jgi:hypothetical protein
MLYSNSRGADLSHFINCKARERNGGFSLAVDCTYKCYRKVIQLVLAFAKQLLDLVSEFQRAGKAVNALQQSADKCTPMSATSYGSEEDRPIFTCEPCDYSDSCHLGHNYTLLFFVRIFRHVEHQVLHSSKARWLWN